MTGDAPRPAVHRDAARLARATAARLITTVVDVQAARGTASLVLTGGRNGNAVLAAVAASPARDAIDWRRLEVWWGDERFLPDGDPERNHTQARQALLDAVPLDPARVHVMAPSDGRYGDHPEAAAEAYAAEVAAAPDPFDVLLLGVGPDTHVASLFPGLPGVRETGRLAVAVRDAPKPPPTRISLTLPAIRSASEVWLLAAGADKAEAAARVLAPGADPAEVPAAGAAGRSRTLLLLDEAAAASLPPATR